MLTPDGLPQKKLVDPATIGECWITSTSNFANIAKYAANSALSPYLDSYIIEACSLVNSICGVKFNEQVADMVISNQNLYIGRYKMIVLANLPVSSIENVWLNVVDTFAPVSLSFIQLDELTGTLKILPDFTTYVQTTLPYYQFGDSSNLWIRYTSGYEVADVPPVIKRATALAVDYLYGLDGLTPNVSSFKTQTYSQTTAKEDEDPIMSRIKNLLKSYKHITMV